MFLIDLLIKSVIYLAVIGLDMIGFFLVIRVLVLRWPVRPLLAFDRVGQSVTDPLVEAATRSIPQRWVDGDVRRKQFAAAGTLLLVSLCRLALANLIS
jgi:hypothetical protein